MLAAVWRRVAVVTVERQQHGDEQRHVQACLLLDQLHDLGRQGRGYLTVAEAQGRDVAVAWVEVADTLRQLPPDQRAILLLREAGPGHPL